MTTGTSVTGARGAAPNLPELARRLRLRLAPAVRGGGRLARATFATVLAGLDGVLVGLVFAYLVAVLISAPGMHLGLPAPVEAAVVVLGAGAVALAGAATGLALRLALRLLVQGCDRLAARIAGPWRRSLRVRPATRRLGGALAGLPIRWLGAFGALLLLANVGDTGLLGLFLPAGALGPYIVLAGVVTGLVAAARHVLGQGAGTLSSRETRPGALPAIFRAPGRGRGAAATLLAGAAVALAGYGGLVMASPGTSAGLVAPNAAFDGVLPATQLADPGAPGTYPVRTLTYGSGTDRHRPAYGSEVDLRTRTVDASPTVWPLGWGADEAREWFWGFGTTEVPINGMAWLPEGDGPFPLVLVVHGNHAMGDFSEPGYAYLGEHLASRGFITVSVDENFLNGSWAADWGGTEQVARAWLLLLHVDQWRTWSGDPASPLHGLVDLDRVALMGHSRGGEAAAVAASIAGKPTAPVPGLAPWPTGLRIRAVVAIAPSDGQYPRGTVVLDGVDYLTLQGGHDSDATSWMGIRQFARTVVGEDGFKAAIWAYRANHGQFSTVWGRSDHGGLGGAILNLTPIQDPADQQDVARTAIGAFLEASLHDQAGYRDLFRRPMVGREWLPADDIYLVRSLEDGFRTLLTGGAARGVEGVTVSATGFESTASRAVPLRALFPDQLTRGLELRWGAADGPACWTVAWTDGFAASSSGLHLSLANGSSEDPGAGPLDPLVELTTTDGVTVALPLSRWGALPPPLPVRLVKDDVLAGLSSMDVARGALPERVLQAYEISFAEFAAADARFDPARIASMRLVIDRTAPGVLWVAEVGLLEGG